MISFLKKELNKGIKVEMEHTDNKSIAKEIAMDHLWEDPNYYIKLKKIESLDMKKNKIKKFDTFVNEELNPQTYFSAADKLQKKGKTERANKLREWGEEKVMDSIEPVRVQVVGGTICHLSSKNVISAKPYDNGYEIFITGDVDMYYAMEDEKQLIKYFHMYKDEYAQWISNPEPEFEVNAFNEFLEFEKQVLFILEIDEDGEITFSGNTLASRKDAFKLWKFITQYLKTSKIPALKNLKITVNDIEFED
jgi:hypothetical protein